MIHRKLQDRNNLKFDDFIGSNFMMTNLRKKTHKRLSGFEVEEYWSEDGKTFVIYLEKIINDESSLIEFKVDIVWLLNLFLEYLIKGGE